MARTRGLDGVLLGLVLLAGAASGLGSAAPRAFAGIAAPACPASQPRVTMTVRIPEPEIDNTLSQLALQGLAGKLHRGDRALGLYRAELQASTRAVLAFRDDGTGKCYWIARVTLEVTMPQRTIYIVRDRRPGTCPYDAVLAHERKHQATDEAVLAEGLPGLRRTLAEAVARLPRQQPVPRGSSAAAEARLDAALRTALRRGLATLAAARTARQSKVDTPEEYRRVRAACG